MSVINYQFHFNVRDAVLHKLLGGDFKSLFLIIPYSIALRVDAEAPCIWKELFNSEDALMQKFPAEALPVYLRHNSADDSYSVLRGEHTQTGSTSWFSILKT